MEEKTLRRLSKISLGQQGEPADDDVVLVKQEVQSAGDANAGQHDQTPGDVNASQYLMIPVNQGIQMSLHTALVEAMREAPEVPGYYYIHTMDDCTEKYIGATKNLKERFRRFYHGQNRKANKTSKEVYENKDTISVIYCLQETTDGAYEKKNKLLDIFRSKHSEEYPAWQKKEAQSKIESSPRPGDNLCPPQGISRENLVKGSPKK